VSPEGDMCAECDRFMEWPRQCPHCLLWFCDSCGPQSAHDCPCWEDEEPVYWDEEDEP
jgi:hypothetical protein